MAIQGSQQRTYVYDDLGRLTSEANPESGMTTYVYDTDSACNGIGLSPTSRGDRISMTDANGNKTCYTYDSFHRVTDVAVFQNGSCIPPVKRFRYDNTSTSVLPAPTGYSAINTSGRMAEAWTGDCVWPTPSSGFDSASDEWFAYSKRGETTDSWESTSHIPGYYHGTASYSANGMPISVGGIPGYASITYGLDGEGRWSSARQGTANIVCDSSCSAASTTYYLGGEPHVVSIGGTADNDTYTYDATTSRMTKYKFTVGSPATSQTGTLTWNQNGTLRTLAVTDGFNAGGAQTCSFGTSTTMGYDDLGRLLSDNCGSAWSQTFSYDQYGNLTKSGSLSWTPGYNPATNRALPPIAYDNDGNLINDTFHQYGWYVDGKLASIDSTTCNIFGSTDGTCILYDAFGRAVEKGVNGVYSEIMYTPIGKAAILTNTTVQSAFFPLPGGASLYETGSSGSNQYFWHKDWVGSVRLSSSLQSRTVYFDRAYAPFGETYTNFGNTGQNTFAGDAQDLFPNLFDAPNRELSSTEGRWMSPDPAGLGAVDFTNPQSWNRYAYVLNSPLVLVDPFGLAPCPPGSENVCTEVIATGTDVPTFDSGDLFGGVGVKSPAVRFRVDTGKPSCKNNKTYGVPQQWQNSALKNLGWTISSVTVNSNGDITGFQIANLTPLNFQGLQLPGNSRMTVQAAPGGFTVDVSGSAGYLGLPTGSWYSAGINYAQFSNGQFTNVNGQAATIPGSSLLGSLLGINSGIQDTLNNTPDALGGANALSSSLGNCTF